MQSPDLRRDTAMREPGTLGAGSTTTAATTTVAMTTTTHKRKRDSTDQGHSSLADDAGRRGSASASAVGALKRVTAGHNSVSSLPSNASSASDASAPPGPHHDLADPTAPSYISAHTSPSRAGTADDDDMHPPATTLEFGAMAPHHNGDDHAPPPPNAPDPSDATSTAAAALAGIYPTMTVPQSTDLSFASSASAGDPDRNLDPSFGMTEHDGGHPHHPHGRSSFDLAGPRPMTAPGRDANAPKPAVGSDEWHRVRRDNHKEGMLVFPRGPAVVSSSIDPDVCGGPACEGVCGIGLMSVLWLPTVERRRRETINEGINELAKIVPGCEKNKGSILQRAVSFITQLKENEAQNIEKWTLEKLLTEQAIAELSATVDKLKAECERAWQEADMWKKRCEDAGLVPRPDEGGSVVGNGTKDGEA